MSGTHKDTKLTGFDSTAGNAAMMALDFLSLLVSKQNPTTASATLTSHLREKVGIGSMGADRLDASNMTPEKTRDKDSIVAGWTMMEISETRDAAQEAARFLEREIAAEGNYWEEVTKVQQSGWSVCKMPNDKSSLGVRFGFSEGERPVYLHAGEAYILLTDP